MQLIEVGEVRGCDGAEAERCVGLKGNVQTGLALTPSRNVILGLNTKHQKDYFPLREEVERHVTTGETRHLFIFSPLLLLLFSTVIIGIIVTEASG